MSMNKEEQIKLVQKLNECGTPYNLKLDIWHPSKEQFDILLEYEELKIGINAQCAHILNFYDGGAEYASPTELTVYLNDEEVETIRQHDKLKDLYNEWFYNKQREEVKI